MPDHLAAFGPVVDGVVVPDEPRRMLHSLSSKQQLTRLFATPTLPSNSPHRRLHSHTSSHHSFPSHARVPDLMLGVSSVESPSIFSAHEERNGISVARRDRVLRTLVRNLYDYHQQVCGFL